MMKSSLYHEIDWLKNFHSTGLWFRRKVTDRAEHYYYLLGTNEFITRGTMSLVKLKLESFCCGKHEASADVMAISAIILF